MERRRQIPLSLSAQTPANYDTTFGPHNRARRGLETPGPSEPHRRFVHCARRDNTGRAIVCIFDSASVDAVLYRGHIEGGVSVGSGVNPVAHESLCCPFATAKCAFYGWRQAEA